MTPHLDGVALDSEAFGDVDASDWFTSHAASSHVTAGLTRCNGRRYSAATSTGGATMNRAAQIIARLNVEEAPNGPHTNVCEVVIDDDQTGPIYRVTGADIPPIDALVEVLGISTSTDRSGYSCGKVVGRVLDGRLNLFAHGPSGVVTLAVAGERAPYGDHRITWSAVGSPSGETQ